METVKNIGTSHKVEDIHFESGFMKLSIDGHVYKIRLAEASQKFVTASDFELNDYEISPAGYGIHWRLLDEDLSINGLMRIANK